MTAKIGRTTREIIAELRGYKSEESIEIFDATLEAPQMDFEEGTNESIRGCAPYNDVEVGALLVEIRRLETIGCDFAHLIRWLESEDATMPHEERRRRYREERKRLREQEGVDEILDAFPEGARVRLKSVDNAKHGKDGWKTKTGLITSHWVLEESEVRVYVDWVGDQTSDIFHATDELQVVEFKHPKDVEYFVGQRILRQSNPEWGREDLESHYYICEEKLEGGERVYVKKGRQEYHGTVIGLEEAKFEGQKCNSPLRNSRAKVSNIRINIEWDDQECKK